MQGIFRGPARMTVIDGAGQCGYAVLHLHLDFTGVHVGMFRQAAVNIFADAFVGAFIVFRPAARKIATPLLILAPALGFMHSISAARTDIPGVAETLLAVFETT